MSSIRARWSVVALASLLGACATSRPPVRQWSRYEVGKVEFFSAQSNRETQALLQSFADFRVIAGELTTASSVEPRIPTEVFLFADQRSYQRTVAVDRSAGVFSRRSNFVIAMNANEAGEELLKHEYTHLLLANTDRHYPTWYNEGFAELLSSLRVVGPHVQMGRVPGDNVDAVAEFARWIPLPELLAGEAFAQRDDPWELHRAYAQAWLVAHYLHIGRPDLAEQIYDYLDRYALTHDAVGSAEVAFGMSMSQFEKELRDYLRGHEMVWHQLPAEQFDLLEHHFVGDPLRPGEAASKLAVLAWRFGNREGAGQYRDAAIEAGEPDPLPNAFR